MLISREDFDKYHIELPATANNNTKLNRAMREAEEIDLALYFNQYFLYDLIKNFTTQINKDLINGKEYTYGTETRKFEGLKPVLCYFAYARLLGFSDISMTYSGPVIKQHEFSDRVPDKRIAAQIGTAESNAKFYLSKVIEYIELNSTTYTKYFCTNAKKQKYKIHNNGL